MRNTTLGILVAGLVLAGFAYLQGGAANVVEGGLISWHTLLEAAPLIVAAFLLSGLMQVLISRDMINRWLGGSSGWRGLFLGAAAGAVIPGGPYGYYPIIATLIKAGAEIGPLIAFIGGKGAWSLSRLPMELAFLGPQLTLIRFVLMLPVPILMAVIARLLFPNISSELRQWQLEATGEGTSDSQEDTVNTP